jgi:hypothetical protein
MTVDVTMKVQGFSEWQTGGSCRAYGKHLPAGGCILITDVDGFFLPVEPQEDCLVGLYDHYGHPVGNAVICKTVSAALGFARFLENQNQKQLEGVAL